MDEDIIYAFVAVLAVLLAGIAVLVPVIGFTLRFALRPVIDSWARLHAPQPPTDQSELLRRQMDLLEAEVQQIQHTVQSLSEAQDFQRRLEANRE